MDQWIILARPYLTNLRDKTGENVSLSVIDVDQRVVVEEFASLNELRPFLSIGGHYPLHAGSASKVLLAYQPRKKRKEILKGKLPRLAPNTITDINNLEEELNNVCQKGYAVSHQERSAFLSSISAPIRNYKKEVISALSIYGPSVRFTPQKLLKFKKLIIENADKISQELGFEYINK
jgi:DNA-binding IclR family transcriptional regulator